MKKYNFIEDISDNLEKCRSNINIILSKIYNQENKLIELKKNSNELKSETFDIKKRIINLGFFNFFTSLKNNKKKEKIQLKKEDYNENLKYENKNEIDLILNEILPNMKENVLKINESLDNQLDLIDESEDNIYSSKENMKKTNNLIKDKL